MGAYALLNLFEELAFALFVEHKHNGAAVLTEESRCSQNNANENTRVSAHLSAENCGHNQLSK